MKSILFFFCLEMYRAVCIQLTNFSCEEFENMSTVSRCHHEIGSMTLLKLFRVMKHCNAPSAFLYFNTCMSFDRWINQITSAYNGINILRIDFKIKRLLKMSYFRPFCLAILNLRPYVNESHDHCFIHTYIEWAWVWICDWVNWQVNELICEWGSESVWDKMRWLIWLSDVCVCGCACLVTSLINQSIDRSIYWLSD